MGIAKYLDTDTIYGVALIYGQRTELGEDWDSIIPKMIEDLQNLADEYAVDLEEGIGE